MEIVSDNGWLTDRSIEPSWLIRFFHSIPHVDFSFQRVNATFNLESSKYKEVDIWELLLNLLLLHI